MRALLMGICLLAATACDEKSPSGPTSPLEERFTLAPGQVAAVQDVDLRIRFVEVTGDSRCPADAVCVRAGDATVHVQAIDAGGTTSFQLNTGDSSRASVPHRQFRIQLVELQPYPFGSRPIQPGDYRATLRVTGP